MGRLISVGLSMVLFLTPLQGLQAQGMGNGNTKFEITAFAGGALFVSDLADRIVVYPGAEGINQPKMDNGVVLGGNLGLRFGQVSLEGSFALVPGAYSGSNTSGQQKIDTNLMVFGGNVLYTLPSDNPLMEVFLAGGAGAMKYDSSDHPNAETNQTNAYGSLGGGLRIFVTPSMALRFEARDYISPFTDGNLQNDIFLTAGLSFSPSGS